MRQRNSNHAIGKAETTIQPFTYTAAGDSGSKRAIWNESHQNHRKSSFQVSIVIFLINLALICHNMVTFQKFSHSLSSPSTLDEPIPRHEDGPPPNLVIHGKRDYYTQVPKEYRKTAWIGDTVDSHIKRAFRSQGWALNKEVGNSSLPHHIVWQFRYNSEQVFQAGQPWQRFSRLPGSQRMESKDGFLLGMREMQQRYNDKNQATTTKAMPQKDLMYFIPETYRLVDEADRKAFTNTIQQDKKSGRHRPWVLKKVTVNNGKGIEMISPDSPELYSAVQRSLDDKENNYVIQPYICNELTWFDGEKFDLRFYWLVASVDPLIVMYHDGYARVGGAKYNETDWTSTSQHLTNHEFRTALGQEDVLADALWRRIRQYHQANKRRLAPKLAAAGGDPVRHVRNQMKEAISATALAFEESLSLKYRKRAGLPEVATENMFSLYGADFIIDADLDVWYIEAQTAPGYGDGYDYRVELFRGLLRPMIHIVEEIALKQQFHAKANLLPIYKLGDYEIVYAGENWRYEYKGYQRSRDKKGCTLSTAAEQNR